MESETWALGDGNSVAYTEDYSLYRAMLSVKGVEWFGTYSKEGRDFGWQAIFPTRLKRRLTKRTLSKKRTIRPQEPTPLK